MAGGGVGFEGRSRPGLGGSFGVAAGTAAAIAEGWFPLLPAVLGKLWNSGRGFSAIPCFQPQIGPVAAQ
ncbi:hypothetical protein D3C76_1506690 [compost metagenome]